MSGAIVSIKYFALSKAVTDTSPCSDIDQLLIKKEPCSILSYTSDPLVIAPFEWYTLKCGLISEFLNI